MRRDEAAEDLRRAAEVVDLENRAAIRGGGRMLPGPSLSEDKMVSLSEPAIAVECSSARRQELPKNRMAVAGIKSALRKRVIF